MQLLVWGRSPLIRRFKTGASDGLVNAVLDRARERNFAGVRLLQAAFHNRSLSLYAKMGFDFREFMSVMQGPLVRKQISGYSVRPARDSDLAECNRVCRQVTATIALGS